MLEEAIQKALKCRRFRNAASFTAAGAHNTLRQGDVLVEGVVFTRVLRVGKPGDNAWRESFFANLKKEAVPWVYSKLRGSASGNVHKDYRNDFITNDCWARTTAFH